MKNKENLPVILLAIALILLMHIAVFAIITAIMTDILTSEIVITSEISLLSISIGYMLKETRGISYTVGAISLVKSIYNYWYNVDHIVFILWYLLILAILLGWTILICRITYIVINKKELENKI